MGSVQRHDVGGELNTAMEGGTGAPEPPLEASRAICYFAILRIH